ncbi:MAG: LuxR C-terminal-related transcriptional regulator [Anaerolineaceae bacterium]|nr:LuxR C-terminal-related transcriptional regulator [Anaerolineaceae bacterium]
MPIPILTTKLYTPPLRPERVVRTRLLERLDEGLRRSCRVTLLCAPAGSGKTTLVTDWLAHLSTVPGAYRPAWLLLDLGDNDPLVFVQYLCTALQQVVPAAGEKLLQAIESGAELSPEHMVRLLANDLAATPERILLVLDDFHVIHSALIQAALGQLVEMQPPNLHLAITTRQDPLLPLARWRGRGQVNEIRLGDLRFSQAEAVHFLNQGMGLGLSAGEIALLVTRTEGWIAGLQLAAVSIRQSGPEGSPAQFVQEFAGDNRYVMDYLVDEVLSHQPAGIQAFLLQTSLLEHLCAPLCEAVLGEMPGAVQPAQAILEELERANLFLIPLDQRREWFRFHHLFAQLLQARLHSQYDAAAIREIHRRAAGWHAQYGSLDRAVDHAVAAQDFEWLAGLLETALKKPAAWSRGEVSRLMGWLERLPAAVLDERPLLCACVARCLHLSGNTDDGIPWIQTAERRLAGWPPSPEKDHLLGIVAASWATCHVSSSHQQQALQSAQEALRWLPATDHAWRGRSLYALASAYDEQGDLVRAAEIYSDLIEITRQAGPAFLMLSSINDLVSVRIRMGQLRRAALLCRQAMEAAAQDGPLPPAAGLIQIGLGLVQYEQNRLVEAQSTLQDALRLAQQGGIGLTAHNSGLLTVVFWNCLARNDLPGAGLALQQMDEYLSTLRPRAGLRQVIFLEASRAALALAAGDVQSAAGWGRTYQQLGPVEFNCEYPDLVLARTCLAQGQLEQGRALLQRWLPDARQRRRIRSQIEIHLLLALFADREGHPDQARAELRQAMEMAAPEGYLRLFVEAGRPLRSLAAALRREDGPGEPKAFLDQILDAIPVPETAPEHPAAPANRALLEPLTERELEVLRYLAGGMSIPDIARQLYLSPNTLKAHTNRIYAKLDTHSRLQAVNKARSLGLIEPPEA